MTDNVDLECPEQYSLGRLIEFLEVLDPELVLVRGFHNPHSYRGYYNELAFEPCGPTKVKDVLATAKSAVGETYYGWKGGEYTMDGYTMCWIANRGACGETLGAFVLGVLVDVSAPKGRTEES